MNKTTKVVDGTANTERGRNDVHKAPGIATAERMDVRNQTGRANYVIETYPRSSYIYSAAIITNGKELEEIDNEVRRRVFKTILK